MFTMPLKDALDRTLDPGNGFNIGLADYPLWRTEYRAGLNQKIINHFWNREIGLETISMFTFNLRRKMWEIMPLYNQVYASTEIEFDPLATYNLATIRTDAATQTGTGTNTGTSTVNSAATSRAVHSETPQTELAGDEDYATSADDANSGSSANTTSNGQSQNNTSTNANGNSTTKGFQGSAADLLTKYRATLLNVDMMVIGELNELFMGVWDDRSEMLPNGYNDLQGWF